MNAVGQVATGSLAVSYGATGERSEADKGADEGASADESALAKMIHWVRLVRHEEQLCTW